MINWKGCGSKRSWPNSQYYAGICLEGLRKTSKNLSQDSRSPGLYLNQGPPEYCTAENTVINLVLERRDISAAAEQLLACEEGLCFVEVVSV
jgi:hypothetical protein